MTSAAQQRPTYLIRLRPRPGVDGIRALRHALKWLGRRAGMVAVEVVEERQMDDVVHFKEVVPNAITRT